MKLSRRSFIKLCSISGGGLALSIAIPVNASPASKPNQSQINIYLQFNRDGTVKYRDTKPEMGQGAGTGLAMIVCDEVGADWNKFIIEKPPLTSSILPIYHSLDSSAGSNAVLSAYMPLREAAASFRQMLIESASEVWNCSPEQCSTENSQVIQNISGDTLNFADLFELVLHKSASTEAKVKSEENFNLIGKSVAEKEIEAIITGAQDFAIDVERKGMLYASLERCPTTDGRVESIDNVNYLATKGVYQTVKVPSFPQVISDAADWQVKYRGNKSAIAVIADSTWAAQKGRHKLNVVWSKSKYHQIDDDNIEKELLNIPGENIRDVRVSGDTKGVISKSNSNRKFQSRYYNPYQENAQMEPLNAVADFDGATLTIWAGSQSPTLAMEYVAHITKVPVENIIFHSMRSGGGFGRRYFYDFIAEVAYLAVHLQKPLKLTWTREDCIRHGKYHLARHDEHSLLLDKENYPIAWDSLTYSESNYGYMGSNRMLDYYAATTPHRSSRHAEGDELVLFPGSWRSVGAHPQVLARECFIDEVAASLKEDPLSLRSRWLSKRAVPLEENNLDEERLRSRQEIQQTLLSLLQHARHTSMWSETKVKGQGRGISLNYFYGTYVCQMAFVSFVNGKIKIDKIICLIVGG